MKETEGQTFNGYLSENATRMIYIRRHDLSGDEVTDRVAKIQEAYDRGLIQYLTRRQLEALMILYPPDLKIPKKADAARSMSVSRQAVQKMDQRLMGNLDKLLNDGPPKRS